MIGSLFVVCAINIWITHNFGLHSVVSTYVYFLLGYAMNQYRLETRRWFRIIMICSVPIFMAAVYLKIDNTIGYSTLLFKVCNFSGILGFMRLSRYLYEQLSISAKWLEYVGRHTLEIYATHFLFVYTFARLDVPVVPLLPILSIIFWAVVVTGVSLSFGILIERIPYLKIIYGKIEKNSFFAFR